MLIHLNVAAQHKLDNLMKTEKTTMKEITKENRDVPTFYYSLIIQNFNNSRKTHYKACMLSWK